MTTNTIEDAVRRVVEYMHVNLGQNLTIDDMARTAMFSKFHFTRIFREVTGTSPGRFLSALRIQEAKRLLVHTALSVADISSQVGYSSVGTFSSRFKACVGLSPSAYRDFGGVQPGFPSAAARLTPTAHNLSVRGRIHSAPGDRPGRIFVGLFPGRMRQGRPARWTVMESPGAFELRDVPVGTWHILVHSFPAGHRPHQLDSEPLLLGHSGPLVVHPGALLRPADILLRAVDALDPPVLLAHFALESRLTSPYSPSSVALRASAGRAWVRQPPGVRRRYADRDRG
ncbi:helix-turn-helix domain-containing protein [Streptomyces globisporus]|uniref:helix-turn-helix domain-containing protein n=2 Tax=Streptomyces TaxID=1883 RepID=UPI00190E1A74|nr:MULTISPECIES: AraC family transcriptional regulator [unclassified Streptomyces]MBK3556823.1 helix-turn-helix transcriptional regulator [Streptomyces sp. MBT56]MBK3602060.1 helix-turn-helix transcriptional regulator [Streptomyces sp. MBT54]MBK3613471.1 helix-turn-helix transcriptional regulator [Streptomyces sp. MBT98]MBK6042923.1 helix-turn-helix transcriptional regulator [Streptomyces sp. MBT55]